MSNYSLYLYPVGSEVNNSLAHEIKQRLSDIEFISKGKSEDLWQPGERMMEFITYLGCSPSLSSGSVESQVRIHTYPKLTALGGESIETVRYPGCRHPLSDPAGLVAQYDPLKTWQCPQCGNAGRLNQINWRKSFGFANLFIEISAIFPKEALPTDSLIKQLSACSASTWSWFYSRSSI